MMIKIAILCACKGSNYFAINIPGVQLDIYDQSKDAFSFKLDCPVIAHPPCAQWSRLRKFSKPDQKEKSLAAWCKYAVDKCGGILEHPSGSLFMNSFCDKKKTISVDQHWWHFPGRKKTLLYFNHYKPQTHPLNFNQYKYSDITSLHSSARSITTIEFNKWLISCIAN
jgi:hypothetical protein